MNKYYSESQKLELVSRYISGESISNLQKDIGVSRSTIYNWIEHYKDHFVSNKKFNMRDYHDLLVRTERQQKIIDILKESPCTVSAPLRERYEVIKSLKGTYSETLLCDALNVSKGSYYNHIFRNKNDANQFIQKECEMTPIIEQIYNESNQIYGPGKVHAVLKDRGYKISVNVVSRIMHQNGLFAIRTSSKTLYEQEVKRKENILNQKFTVNRPNEVWVSDVTEFNVKCFTFYICVIIDLYARKVISYKISRSNNTKLIMSTFREAYESRHPDNDLIFHSDNGTNYCSRVFMQYLKTINVRQSFSRPHIPYDNSVAEAFFKHLKAEELYRTRYRSEREFKESVNRYMTFYNTERPHSVNRYRTPDKWEKQYWDRNNRT